MVWMLSNQINGSVQDLNEYINDFYARIIYVEKLRDNFDHVDMVIGYEDGDEFVA